MNLRGVVLLSCVLASVSGANANVLDHSGEQRLAVRAALGQRRKFHRRAALGRRSSGSRG
jgi:hypothetical protein